MNTTFRYLSRALLLAMPLLVACGEPAREPQGEASMTSGRAVTLADVQALGVPNTAMPFDNLVTMSQPTQEQFGRLVEMGYSNFISLRPSTEEGAGWEEAMVPDEGISFVRLPVSGADGLTRDNVEALDHLLGQTADQPTVLYCASSGRVGAMLALRAYWMHGASPEAALALGREAGLTRLEPAVVELLSAPR